MRVDARARLHWAEHYIRQVERYYVVRVDSPVVAPQIDLAAEDVHELRWWTLAEIAASQEQFAPSRLGTLVRELLADGPRRADRRRRLGRKRPTTPRTTPGLSSQGKWPASRSSTSTAPRMSSNVLCET